MLAPVIFFHIINLQRFKAFQFTEQKHAPTNTACQTRKELCDDQVNVNTRATTAALLFMLSQAGFKAQSTSTDGG